MVITISKDLEVNSGAIAASIHHDIVPGASGKCGRRQ